VNTLSCERRSFPFQLSQLVLCYVTQEYSECLLSLILVSLSTFHLLGLLADERAGDV